MPWVVKSRRTYSKLKRRRLRQLDRQVGEYVLQKATRRDSGLVAMASYLTENESVSLFEEETTPKNARSKSLDVKSSLKDSIDAEEPRSDKKLLRSVLKSRRRSQDDTIFKSPSLASSDRRKSCILSIDVESGTLAPDINITNSATEAFLRRTRAVFQNSKRPSFSRMGDFNSRCYFSGDVNSFSLTVYYSL